MIYIWRLFNSHSVYNIYVCGSCGERFVVPREIQTQLEHTGAIHSRAPGRRRRTMLMATKNLAPIPPDR